ncbi:hypothetical protein KCP78_22915 [Salmonella enterica subsp. enterica]|nr:hypothetical protein KCP78_22915 [Salmonella enterica subsp. enterica]
MPYVKTSTKSPQQRMVASYESFHLGTASDFERRSKTAYSGATSGKRWVSRRSQRIPQLERRRV